jgi:predicted MFS family arabinose efflux permease
MLAGALLATAGASFVFDLNVASFLAILVALMVVRVPARPLADAPTSSGELRNAGAFSAVGWALKERGPRRLLLGLFAFALLAAPVQGLLPVYAADLLKVGAAGYGVLLSCLGAGAIVGALSLARLPKSYPRHHLIPLSMLGFASCAMVYALSRWMLLSCAALAVGGVFWVWSLASSSTAMQLLVPDSLRGRAMSVLSLATTGPLPLGHLLGGTLAHAFGARFAVAVTAAALGLFALWAAAFREPGIDAIELPPPSPRGFREALWEALTAQSHRAQVIEPGVPPGNAEPVDR